ncbi:MAG: response regulator [Chitinophagaceae bacterium]|nr:MAG: response regulator [Chitinophagaceae bacterium]
MNIHHPIIIIDEDQDDLQLISDAHKDIGIRNPLITYNTCEEVLPALQKLKVSPLLMICDFRFRTMNGLQLKSQLLQHRNSMFSGIPFIIWSSVVEPMHVKMAKDLDIHGFYLKPSTFVELQDIYTTIIRQWGYAGKTSLCY